MFSGRRARIFMSETRHCESVYETKIFIALCERTFKTVIQVLLYYLRSERHFSLIFLFCPLITSHALCMRQQKVDYKVVFLGRHECLKVLFKKNTSGLSDIKRESTTEHFNLINQNCVCFKWLKTAHLVSSLAKLFYSLKLPRAYRAWVRGKGL